MRKKYKENQERWSGSTSQSSLAQSPLAGYDPHSLIILQRSL